MVVHRLMDNCDESMPWNIFTVLASVDTRYTRAIKSVYEEGSTKKKKGGSRELRTEGAAAGQAIAKLAAGRGGARHRTHCPQIKSLGHQQRQIDG